MERADTRADFSGALSALIVVALIAASTAVMLVTFNTARAAGESAAVSCRAYAMASVSCGSRTDHLISLSLLAK
jgi:hypothetical protein